MINWGIGQGQPNAGDMFMQGMERGRQVKQQQVRGNALAALAVEPGNQNALNDLLRVAPEEGYKIAQQQRQQQAAMEQQQVIGQAVQGNPGAMDHLAGLNPEMWMKLDERVKTHAKAAADFMGQAGLHIGSLPEEQKAQAWAEAVRMAEIRGFDIPTEYEAYSPQAFNAAMAEAGKVKELADMTAPRFQSIAPGGGLIAMDRNGSNPGYVIAPPDVASPQMYVPAGERGAQQSAPQMAPQSPAAAPTGQFMAMDGAKRMLSSLGPQRFVSWQSQHRTPVQITNANDYASLPRGTLFIPPEGGQARVKQ